MTEQPFPPTYQEFRQQVADNIQRGLDVPVFQVPLPVDPPSYHFAADLARDNDEVQTFTASKQGYIVMVTNEELANAEVWPVRILSPEEREARNKAAREQLKLEVAEVKARLGKADPALAPIIAHHAPLISGYAGLSCTGCDAGAYAEEAPEWPCSTIDLILDGLGA